MTKLYRVVAYVLDLNGGTPLKGDVVQQIENNHYPEFIDVQEVREADVGEWDDDHQLNQAPTMAQYDAYFAELNAPPGDPWLQKEHQRVRSIMLTQITKNGQLQRKIEELEQKLAGLAKVQEFVKTIGDLTK